MGYSIAVVGATGNVGRETLAILAERSFPADKVIALASERSRGAEVSYGEDKVLKVQSLEDFDFKGIDIAFFSPGSKVSAVYAPKAAKAGAIVIDKTSHFRMDPDIPLVIPEVNPEAIALYKKRNMIANPNCVTIPLAMVLKPLHDKATLKRVVASTYQSVSGAGRGPMDELFRQTKSIFVNDPLESQYFTKQIAFNVIPHIDDFRHDGSTGEEEKIVQESRKILSAPLKMIATCVRVPVFIGHSISATIEFENEISVEEARKALKAMEGVLVYDKREDGGYVTPLDVAGEDRVVVSRIRKDASVPHGIALWIAADNLRKGAALNAVQIAEKLVKDYL